MPAQAGIHCIGPFWADLQTYSGWSPASAGVTEFGAVDPFLTCSFGADCRVRSLHTTWRLRKAAATVYMQRLDGASDRTRHEGDAMENLLPTMRSISDLVHDFELGTIAVPEIQRDVVWGADKVKDLIDSITRSYPCGSLILWEPRERDRTLVRSMIRPERLDESSVKLPRYFLLDGQQRLTALASVFLPREKLKTILAELEEEMPFIFINLKRFPTDIQATTDIGRYSYPWVPFHRFI